MTKKKVVKCDRHQEQDIIEKCPDCINELIHEQIDLYYDYFECIYSHIDAIETETDPEVISVYIEAIEKINTMIPEYLVGGKINIKKEIKRGNGIFKPIQKKCRQLKLV